MNLDEIFQLDADTPMVAMDPWRLGACILVAIAIGWFCAWRYRNTYDVKKSIRLYIPLGAAAAVIFTVLGIPALFAVGAQLCGFVAMLLISNRYF